MKPCEHFCHPTELDLREKNGTLRWMICRVCKRTWTLMEAVPEKGWPSRWFVNCTPPVDAAKPRRCRVDSCDTYRKAS